VAGPFIEIGSTKHLFVVTIFSKKEQKLLLLYKLN